MGPLASVSSLASLLKTLYPLVFVETAPNLFNAAALSLGQRCRFQHLLNKQLYRNAYAGKTIYESRATIKGDLKCIQYSMHFNHCSSCRSGCPDKKNENIFSSHSRLDCDNPGLHEKTMDVTKRQTGERHEATDDSISVGCYRIMLRAGVHGVRQGVIVKRKKTQSVTIRKLNAEKVITR